MSEHSLENMLPKSSVLIGQALMFPKSFPIDFTKDNMRFLRSGYAELDVTKFDASMFGPVRIQPEVVATPKRPIAVADNGAGIIVAIAAGSISAGIIMRSADNGKTWSVITPTTAQVPAAYNTLEPSLVRGSCLTFIDGYFYIGLKAGSGSSSAGIIRSNDGGLNWEVVSNGLTGSSTYTVMQIIKAGAKIFALTPPYIYVSSNGGATWSQFKTTANITYNALAASNDGRLFACGTNSSLNKGIIHHTNIAQNVWYERVVAEASSSLYDILVEMPTADTYLVKSGGVVASTFRFYSRTLSSSDLDGALGLNVSDHIAVGAGISSSAACARILKDGSKHLLLASGVFESTVAVNNYSLRIGQPPQLKDLMLAQSGFMYGVPNAAGSTEFYRFKDAVPAGGLAFELTSGETVQYVRVS